MSWFRKVDYDLNHFCKDVGRLSKEKSSALPPAEREFRIIQGMIDAMTMEERRSPRLIDASRLRRIAAGSGVSGQEVKQFLTQFEQVRMVLLRLGNINLL